MSEAIIIAVLVAIPATITAYAALVNARNGAVKRAAKDTEQGKDEEIAELEQKVELLEDLLRQLLHTPHTPRGGSTTEVGP